MSDTYTHRHTTKQPTRLLLLVLAIITLTFIGCQSHKHIKNGNNTGQTPAVATHTDELSHSPRLDTILNVNCNYYTANFSCTVEGIGLTGQIRMAKDSIIWVSFNKIIEVGRAVLTPTRVQGYVKILNKYYDGDYETLKTRWGLDVDYETLEALLLGNCPPKCAKSREPKQEGDEITLWYSQKGNNQRDVTLKKHAVNKTLNSTELFSPQVQQRIFCTYSRNQTQDGQQIPETIGISLKCKRITTSTKLELNKITLNQRQNYPFSIPAKFKAI